MNILKKVSQWLINTLVIVGLFIGLLLLALALEPELGIYIEKLGVK